jgi:hypothetical protein
MSKTARRYAVFQGVLRSDSPLTWIEQASTLREAEEASACLAQQDGLPYFVYDLQDWHTVFCSWPAETAGGCTYEFRL